jgi:D-beta-D-heptose 7-phosphate kinase/D-beta-D-heptose 1-phosphate adenosyltransferase
MNSQNEILVIGDSCTDVFVYGDVERICPEAPVPIFNTRTSSPQRNGGMARNVYNNIIALGGRADIITNSATITKTRLVDSRLNQIVLRIDESDTCERVKLNSLNNINKYKSIIVSDYCKGFLLESDIEYICNNHNNVFVDTKKNLGNWIVNANFIKINHLEFNNNINFINENETVKNKLIMTKGKEGCIYQDEIFPTEDVPVKDVSGAGDTFLSALVLNYIKNNDIIKAINFAQECTTKAVQKRGVSTL